MNRLYCRPRQSLLGADASSAAKRTAVADDTAEYYRLHKEWAALNGLKESGVAFGPRKLAGLPVGHYPRVSDDTWGYPGCDHGTFYKKRRRPAAIVIEPYDGEGDNVFLGEDGERESVDPFGATRDYLRPLGLVLHTPPNPYASFWYPGLARLAVVTREEFGPVFWLPEQLEYEGDSGAGFGSILGGKLAARTIVYRGMGA